MAKILIASVPLSGHVNPALPLAKMLISRGHEVVWYSGAHYKEVIEATGARFFPFVRAKDFHDSSIRTQFPDLPYRSLFKHATYYIKHLFYDNMPGQYLDLTDILHDFPADLLLTDEWFTGAIPFAERKILPWICYCNSPLFYYTDEIPFPGAGIFPSSTRYGVNRNRIVNWMVTKLIFAKTHAYINSIRTQLDLPPMSHFFIINNIFLSDLFIKFNTPAFEFRWKDLPPQIRFVGPVIPSQSISRDYAWAPLLQSSKAIIFITQGSVNITNYNKLIIPALKALQHSGAVIIVATGSTSTEELSAQFASDTVFIEKYIPYDYILPHCQLMITNGGFGGVITALYYGVPLVVAGDTEDKPKIAARIEYCKVGINLGTGHPSPKRIRKAVNTILNNPIYATNAMNIRDDFRKHDAPKETTRLIEELINHRSA